MATYLPCTSGERREREAAAGHDGVGIGGH